MQFNILEAKNQLSKLVKAALDGEEVVIANNGQPMVKLVRIANAQTVRKPGAWRNLPPAAEDWDAPATNRAIARSLLNANPRSTRGTRAPKRRPAQSKP